ncbi:MAG TPA: DUF305 domain-containing protein [Sphingomicrobium sp.]|nr:DUF305 domain-containing protein [Sphingomicrobium sp.]
MDPGREQHGAMSKDMEQHHYRMLAINLCLSLIIMYVAMFAMIWSWGEFIHNVNFFSMALVMWAPMSAVMMMTMRSMYRNAKLNAALYALFALVLLLSFIGIREQSFVGDRQFLRSMIPHHSGAILMCEKARLADPEIKQLCGDIIASQEAEIAQMKALLERKR